MSPRLFGRLAANLLGMLVTGSALAGTFGSVVAIGGHASDLALDELRGVVYVANFTANRIDVVSTGNGQLSGSFNVAAQPGSIALSPNSRYLVAAHFGNFKAEAGPVTNALTVLDLSANVKQTFALGSPALGVAFGADGLALVVTTQEFLLLDPVSGVTRVLSTFSDVTAKDLPVPNGTPPPEIVRASVAASGDASVIYGLAETGGPDQVLIFRYSVANKQIAAERWVASPPMGPRVCSVDRNGSVYITGWGMFNRGGYLVAQFRNASGVFGVGGHAIDSVRGLVYAQVEQAAPETDDPAAPKQAAVVTDPVLMVADADNLAVRERLRLPENLAGKSVLSSNGEMLYAVSESGLMFLPVGALARSPRVAASQEDVVFRGSFCDRQLLVQEIDIINPGGGKTDFVLSSSTPGILISPASGTTPARVSIAVSTGALQNQKGTLAGTVEILSAGAVNIAPPIRVLINNREPDQRGTFVNVPGKLVDLLADPGRNRFYVLRQDTNQVLVFDATSYKQVAALRTGNTPMSMAMTLERKYLLVGNDDSQIANVYDLDTLKQTPPVVFPPGHYPRSIAAAGGAILAASRVAGPVHTIDRVDLWTRTAATLPSLGVFENKIDINTVLTSSPSGASIFAAQNDGTVLLYDSSANTFVVSRKLTQKLTGAYAAVSDDRFLVDNRLLNASLVPVQTLENGSGLSSGFALADLYGVRTTAPASTLPGVIQRVDITKAASVRPTRMVEAPVLSDAVGTVTGAVFTRTLAPLASRAALVSLTTSGFTVLPWNYDAAVADPRIDKITSAADGSAGVASGGLVTLTGTDLGLVNMASREVPLPTALADSCLTVNGVLAPMVMVSSTQVNAQLPYQVSGPATVVLRTPAGVSNNFKLNILPAAPAVFRVSEEAVATVVRVTNKEIVTLSNPIHLGEWIVIYATGLGLTSPAVDDGYPGPSDPPAEALIPASVTLGGVPLDVSYAGLAPGQVGVYQINAYVPARIPTGMDIPLTIDQAGTATTLSVRVVK